MFYRFWMRSTLASLSEHFAPSEGRRAVKEIKATVFITEYSEVVARVSLVVASLVDCNAVFWVASHVQFWREFVAELVRISEVSFFYSAVYLPSTLFIPSSSRINCLPDFSGCLTRLLI